MVCREMGKRCSDSHNQIGKAPAPPGDSRTLIVPGIVACLGLEFASFPLTPTLSPRRGRALAPRWKIRTLRLQSPPLCLSFRRHTRTKPDSRIKARPNVSPSPRGEGWGEGKEDTRNFGRLRFGLGAGGPPTTILSAFGFRNSDFITPNLWISIMRSVGRVVFTAQFR
jgi:hypothetical protein